MLTPSQHHDLTTNAQQRTTAQWAIKLQAPVSSVSWQIRKHRLPTAGRRYNRHIDLDLLRAEAASRTHQQWAEYFGVTKERMYVVCSREGVRVKPNDRYRRIDIEYLSKYAQERTHKEWAEHFGVTVNSMWNVCSNNNIKVKNSYGL